MHPEHDLDNPQGEKWRADLTNFRKSTPGPKLSSGRSPRLNHNYIGTGNILLGLVKEEEALPHVLPPWASLPK
jgi:hypothetical protein